MTNHSSGHKASNMENGIMLKVVNRPKGLQYGYKLYRGMEKFKYLRNISDSASIARLHGRGNEREIRASLVHLNRLGFLYI